MTRVNPRMGFFSVKCTHEQNATFKHQKLWISIKLWILHYKLWILSYKLRAVEAKSTFSLGSGGGEKKAGGREPNVSAALALISTACFTLLLSLRKKQQSYRPVLEAWEFMKDGILVSISRSRAETEILGQEFWESAPGDEEWKDRAGETAQQRGVRWRD